MEACKLPAHQRAGFVAMSPLAAIIQPFGAVLALRRSMQIVHQSTDYFSGHTKTTRAQLARRKSIPA